MTERDADATLELEPSRPAIPTGCVERDGVRMFWERYGAGETTLLFLPAWSVVHSRVWKGQLPYFGRHYRALAFDPRGNGRSDKPSEPAAYADTETVADAIAVMDATGTERAMWSASRWAAGRARSSPGSIPTAWPGRF